MTYYIFGNAV